MEAQAPERQLPLAWAPPRERVRTSPNVWPHGAEHTAWLPEPLKDCAHKGHASPPCGAHAATLAAASSCAAPAGPSARLRFCRPLRWCAGAPTATPRCAVGGLCARTSGGATAKSVSSKSIVTRSDVGAGGMAATGTGGGGAAGGMAATGTGGGGAAGGMATTGTGGGGAAGGMTATSTGDGGAAGGRTGATVPVVVGCLASAPASATSTTANDPGSCRESSIARKGARCTTPLGGTGIPAFT